MSKYNARKTTIDGVTFDSIREATYYCELKLRQHAGEFKEFSLQPEFILLEAFSDSADNRHRAIKYKADFLLHHADGSMVVVDVKGVRTREYAIKKKLFLAKYPEYKFMEV